MTAPEPEDFLTLYCDPGEDFGWCVGKGLDLLAAGTEKMWPMADAIWDKLLEPAGDHPEPQYAGVNPLSTDTYIRDGVDGELMKLRIGRVVCEDFRIYPWAVQDLAFDKVRTARVIGAITFMCRLTNIPLLFQGANIKKAAVAAGAEELYYRPLNENRHQNDAIQHYVFYTNVELMGLPLPVPDSVEQESYELKAARYVLSWIASFPVLICWVRGHKWSIWSDDNRICYRCDAEEIWYGDSWIRLD